MEVLWLVLIGLAAGWLASRLMKAGGYGLVGDLVVGLIGAMIGGFFLKLVGEAPGSLLGRLIAATVGAMVLIALVRKLRGRRRR